jgi:uncharacterized protein (DUF4415 family)
MLSEFLALVFGEMVKKHMKKKIKYTDEPIFLGKRVYNLIPSPAELAAMEKKEKITINLDSETLAFFKEQAKIYKTSYQVMIRNLLKSVAAGLKSNHATK